MGDWNIDEKKEYMMFTEACQLLQISTATGRNWIRQGRWTPLGKRGRQKYFLRRDVEALMERVQAGREGLLRSRRNKTQISGRLLYDTYVSVNCKGLGHVKELMKLLEKREKLEEEEIRCILADAALHMMLSSAPEEGQGVKKGQGGREEKPDTPWLLDYLQGDRFIADPACKEFLEDLIPEGAEELVRRNQDIFTLSYIYEERQDILGLIYMSCREQGSRKKMGAYYTPTITVQKMMGRLFGDGSREEGKESSEWMGDILDPCCGTGNFLLQLPEDYPLEYIYGNDLDRVSVLVARLNLAMRYPGSDPQMIRSHITCRNYVTEYPEDKNFRYIIGNPPWGIAWTSEELENLHRQYRTIPLPGRRQVESADVFLEKALRTVVLGGHIAFVMPEAILHVQAHQEIRRLMMECIHPEYLEYAGELFRGVQCPSILLQIQKTGEAMKIQGLQIIQGAEHFTVKRERNLQNEDLLLHIRDEEYELLQKLAATADAEFLKDQAEFALGVVTGDNDRWVRKKEEARKSQEEEPGSMEWEPILRGSDIQAYRMKPSQLEIIFQPEAFQQTAPERFYRAPQKLVYRFIADHPIVAWDPHQTLTLNSGNILIPRIPDLDMRYIMAVLNSRIVRFYYKKRFRSVKVLRSYLEQIPIPRGSREEREKVLSLVNARMVAEEEEEILALDLALEKMMQDLYRITEEEYAWICREC